MKSLEHPCFRHRYSEIHCLYIIQPAFYVYCFWKLKVYEMLYPIYSENCDKLAKELEDYEHVTVAVVHDIKVVDEGTSQVLQNLPVGSVHDNCILLLFDFILTSCYVNCKSLVPIFLILPKYMCVDKQNHT